MVENENVHIYQGSLEILLGYQKFFVVVAKNGHSEARRCLKGRTIYFLQKIRIQGNLISVI